MRHRHHYTIEEANDCRPWVAERLDRVREAMEVLEQDGVRDLIDEGGQLSGGSYPGREAAKATLIVSAIVAELQDADVIVHDAEKGLVDFPSIMNGNEVYLCWQDDEDEVSWWHSLDSGFTGRHPI